MARDPKLRAQNYQQRVNAVIDHVATDLSTQHSVAELAAIANFSKYHFHRIFHALTGEPVAQMVLRLRLEGAASALIYQRSRPVTDIALAFGFSSSANFSKAFAKHFSISPSAYRRHRARREPGPLTVEQVSKIGKASTVGVLDDAAMEQQLHIVDMVATPLAYLRRIGSYADTAIRDLFDELSVWVEQHDCAAKPAVSIGITWSDSQIAAEERWRYDACVAVTPQTRPQGAVGTQTLPACRIAQLALSLPHTSSLDLSPYWQWLLGRWLPQSGYEPDAVPSFEIYDSSTQHFSVRLCLPIVAQHHAA